MTGALTTIGGIFIIASSVRDEAPEITEQSWGNGGGKAVDRYRLKNSKGNIAKVCNSGGIVTSPLVPCKIGKPGDVMLSYDTLAEYLEETPYCGCLVGRYGNCIGKGKFLLTAFYLLCFCIVLQITLATARPKLAAEDLQKLFWEHPFDALKSPGWPGLANYKVLAALVFIAMSLRYYIFQ